MEIKVGDYVRTKNGKIRTVKNTVAQYYITDRLNISDNNQFVKEDIIKHSKNIINLVEVGDYVNGYKVISVDYDVIDNKTECIELDLNNNYQYNFISTNQIKTIITKKQFSSIEYKVEE